MFYDGPGVCKQYSGPVGQSTLLAGTTSALSATRRGPELNRPTRLAFLKTGTNPYS